MRKEAKLRRQTSDESLVELQLMQSQRREFPSSGAQADDRYGLHSLDNGVTTLLLGPSFCWLWAEFARWEFYGSRVLLGLGILSHQFSIQTWAKAFITERGLTR